MKKVFILLLSTLFIGAFQSLSAQCSACIIDYSCNTTPAEPVSCPDTLYPDTAGKPYFMNLTYYLPDTFDITSPTNATVVLQQMKVLGVTGLPAGLTWSTFDYTGADTTIFYPNQSDSAEHICASICGTPLVPGTYTVVVSALATVDVISPNIGVQTSSQNFTYQLLIYADPSGNTAFTLSPDQGCGSAVVDYDPVLLSNGDPLFEYKWVFGNGDTSYLESPTGIQYSSPGTYVVTHTTTQLQYVITNVSASVISDAWCSGDITEFCGGLFPSKPDMKFKINDGNSSQDSPIIDNDFNPVWSSLNMPVTSTSLIIEFIETDGLLNADDDMGQAIINITGTGQYSVNAGPGDVSAIVTIGTQVFATLTDTDTVMVYPLPVPPVLTSSIDSICDGDSITVNSTSGFSTYQWYNNNAVIPGETDTSIIVYSSSSLTIEISDTNGCTNISDSINVVVVANPPAPSVFYDFPNGTLTSTTTVGFNHQWYYGNGTLISGATSNIYQAADTGFHYIVVWNDFGCSDTSDFVYVSKVVWPDGIEELSVLSGFKIVPNPNKGLFNVNFSKTSTDVVNGTIIDLSGRQVHLFSILPENSSEAIDASHLRAGVYLLKLNDGTRIQTEKLIIK